MTTPEIVVAMKAEIRKLTAALAILEGTGRTVVETKPAPVQIAPKPKRGKRRMSPAARKKIAAAQKERWAKFHAAKNAKRKAA
jgi:methyl coenzyme M reductase subunit D